MYRILLCFIVVFGMVLTTFSQVRDKTFKPEDNKTFNLFGNDDYNKKNIKRPIFKHVDLDRNGSDKHKLTSFGRFSRSLIAPAIIAGVGLYSGSPSNTHDWLGKHTIYSNINDNYPDFHSGFDNFLQWGPAALFYGLNVNGVYGVHNTLTSTKLLVVSELLMTASVIALKRYTKNIRPKEDGFNSLPSGHTSQAFVTATFLHRELGGVSKWYSVAGYSMATMVGGMRMLNGRHWFNDVVIGAALGTGITNFVYWLNDSRRNRKDRNWIAVPSVSDKHAMVSLIVAL